MTHSTTYKGREINVSRGNSYGHYKITSKFYGREITCTTTDSEMYDWINDNSNRSKHSWAKKAAYIAIQRAAESERENRIINA